MLLITLFGDRFKTIAARIRMAMGCWASNGYLSSVRDSGVTNLIQLPDFNLPSHIPVCLYGIFSILNYEGGIPKEPEV